MQGSFEKGGDPSEVEPDPDPLADPLCSVLDALCDSGELDDHGDTLACATRLELPHLVDGEIGNDWGDDRDVFMFTLADLQTVAIETIGESDTIGGLYDRYGHRLSIDDDGGSDNNFRMVKTLVPGRYFVRVEGRDQTEGAYRLSVRSLSWR